MSPGGPHCAILIKGLMSTIFGLAAGLSGRLSRLKVVDLSTQKDCIGAGASSARVSIISQQANISGRLESLNMLTLLL